MQNYKGGAKLLKKVKSAVKRGFPQFGINKSQEISRLLYEISKRDNLSPTFLIRDINNKSCFANIKESLFRKRFPYVYIHNESFKPYLPNIDLDPKDVLKPKKKVFYPKKIFIEKLASNSYLAKCFKKSFPKSSFVEIRSLKEYTKNVDSLKMRDYNKRCDALFIVNEKLDFFKVCPCTKSALGCGYHIFNLGLGCIFECTYCYLQGYINAPGIILPANIDKYFDEFRLYKKRGMRIGTGEFSDSLMLDNITGYSGAIIEFFKKHKDVTFEFKTKSANIENLLKIKHSGNIVVSWSLNPQRVINENEFFSASLAKRVESIFKCVKAGYKIGLHFDPIIYISDWQKKYGDLIDFLFSKIKPKDVAWISLGTLRFKPEIKKVIEGRFPNNKILDEELGIGYDNKLRYPYGIRYKIYEFLIQSLSKYSKNMFIYLCMEERSMWQDLRLT